MPVNKITSSTSEILVSIIIPVYNVLPYLDRCMDSLLAQTHSNLEILFIDDGSTDGSGERCDEYASKDTRVIALHKENGGPSDARNLGLDHATGEYITFVDSDDEILPTYVEKLLCFAQKKQLDFVIASYVKIGDYTPSQVFLDELNARSCTETVYTQKEAMLRMLYRKDLSMYSHGKLYKSDIFKNLRFPSGKLFEDVTTTWEVVKLVDRVGYINATLYLYRQHYGSIVNNHFTTPKMEEVYTHKKIMKDVAGDQELYAAAISKYFYCLLDLYSQTTPAHVKERKYLKKGIKAYRYQVLKDRHNDIFARIMAFLSFLPSGVVRSVGSWYKKQNQNKWYK